MSRFVTRAGDHIAELAKRSAEAGRLSRGRALFRKGSVVDLWVIEGSVIASVRGSKGDEYETTIGTALASPGVIRQIAQANDPGNPRNIDDLIGDGVDVCPRETDLGFSCDCADWEEPCKHVVAALLAFADRIDLDEAELLHWRGIDLSDLVTERSAPESAQRSAPGRPDGPQLGAEQEDRSTRLSELEALLGDTVMRVPGAAGSDPEQPPPLDPALAHFLGVGMTLDEVDGSEITAAAPLFTDVQLGPLADLGPELAAALATITAKLEDVSTR